MKNPTNNLASAGQNQGQSLKCGNQSQDLYSTPHNLTTELLCGLFLWIGSCLRDDTIDAKHAFEKFARKYHVTVKHYHANNGVFAAKNFCKTVNRVHRMITFCWVNIHHQNCVAEWCIKDLTKKRNGTYHVPVLFDPTLFSKPPNLFVICRKLVTANRRSRSSQDQQWGQIIRSTIFTLSAVWPMCWTLLFKPTNRFWSGMIWNQLGVHPCFSPNHATNVALILNTTTEYVSPQFHYIWRSLFHQDCTNQSSIVSSTFQWQVKCRTERWWFMTWNQLEGLEPYFPFHLGTSSDQSEMMWATSHPILK